MNEKGSRKLKESNGNTEVIKALIADRGYFQEQWEDQSKGCDSQNKSLEHLSIRPMLVHSDINYLWRCYGLYSYYPGKEVFTVVTTIRRKSS